MMKSTIVGLIAASALLSSFGAVQAQTYPSQDIHIVVGFAPGSGPDITARYLAEQLRAKFGKAVLVENKPGAVGNIATEYVARAKPDGHTLLLNGGGSLAATAYLFKNPPVDVRTFETVATMTRAPILMVVSATSPYHTVADLSAALKIKGEKASYGTAFPSARILGAIYRNAIGINAVEIQYRTSADWINDLSSGTIDFGFIDASSGVGFAKAGRFRVIAVTSAERSSVLPDIPTLTENGTKTDLIGWWAVFAPQGTPKPILDQLHGAISDSVKTEDARKFFAATGNDIWVTTREAATAAFLKDYKDWAEYVKIAKIEPQG